MSRIFKTFNFLLDDRVARSRIGYWHHDVSVCLSVRLSLHLSVMQCTVTKRYILQQKSEQVNRKCPRRNTILQLSTPMLTQSPQTLYLLSLQVGNKVKINEANLNEHRILTHI